VAALIPVSPPVRPLGCLVPYWHGVAFEGSGETWAGFSACAQFALRNACKKAWSAQKKASAVARWTQVFATGFTTCVARKVECGKVAAWLGAFIGGGWIQFSWSKAKVISFAFVSFLA